MGEGSDRLHPVWYQSKLAGRAGSNCGGVADWAGNDCGGVAGRAGSDCGGVAAWALLTDTQCSGARTTWEESQPSKHPTATPLGQTTATGATLITTLKTIDTERAQKQGDMSCSTNQP